tara:strand:- start:514 stop:1758 length:1245 start_codon:yes stop_codon:yes gene_type:complete
MIDYKKAILKIKRNKIKINSEKILSINSINRVASSDVYSPDNYPSANNSSFDGYAINSKETKNLVKKKFKILKTIAAGDNPKTKKVPKNSTIEVMTGAIIPKPFDAVIPIEQIKIYPKKNKYKYIIVDQKINKNDYIRFEGSDFKKNEKVINKGEIIKPQHILALKALGIKKILVKKKPSIVFYTTGNEISNNEKIPKWKVRNSNGYYINSFLNSLPIIFKEKKILKDHHKSKFKKEIKNFLRSDSELIITSGAISAGKFDFVPQIIKQFKIKELFKSVAMRPGKPVMFAKFNKNKSFFGLPGNPISSVACFRFLVLPFLLYSLGVNNDIFINAKIKNKFVKKKKFTRFIKGRIYFSKKGTVEFQILKGQESYKISPFVNSNAWGLFPSGKAIFKKGEYIKCFTHSGTNELFIS